MGNIDFKNIWWPKSTEDDFNSWTSKKESFTCKLDEIAQKFNCDKANAQLVSRRFNNGQNTEDIKIPGHNYTEIYDYFFKEIKDADLNILEFGIGNYPTNGYSLRLWLEYFTKAKITLLDWSDQNFNFNFEFDASRVKFFKIDQNNEDQLLEFSINSKDKFDIIIDDCSHQGDHQYNTLKHFFTNLLNENGMYFIEDIHDSEFLKYLPIIYDNLNSGNVNYSNKYESVIEGISEIRMYRSLIYLKKGERVTR